VVLRALSNIDRCVTDIPEEAKFGNQVRYQPTGTAFALRVPHLQVTTEWIERL
jgi:hypothetical protein